MFQYRQVLVRLRQGDSERDIARARLMGRRKAKELRALALERGHTLTSETDTEAIAHLVEEAYDGDLAAAVRDALGRLEGAYALVVMHTGDVVVEGLTAFTAATRKQYCVLGERDVARNSVLPAPAV